MSSAENPVVRPVFLEVFQRAPIGACQARHASAWAVQRTGEREAAVKVQETPIGATRDRLRWTGQCQTALEVTSGVEPGIWSDTSTAPTIFSPVDRAQLIQGALAVPHRKACTTEFAL